MPLGILPDTVFASEMVELSRHCRVLLYTDGLTEALAANGERFGQERLSAWLAGVNGNAKELKEDLVQQLAHFQRKISLNDDQTFLMMVGSAKR
jgi:serine phosphatase RsbU (regulator of sigma subunit)